jgi:hypothetical protein
MSISDEQTAAFKAKYGEDLAFHESAKYGAFVFKKPSRTIWKKFQVMAQRKNADTDTAGEQMVIDCLCYPEADTGKPDHTKLRALFEDFPALPSRIFAELYELAQGSETASGKL